MHYFAKPELDKPNGTIDLKGMLVTRAEESKKENPTHGRLKFLTHQWKILGSIIYMPIAQTWKVPG